LALERRFPLISDRVASLKGAGVLFVVSNVRPLERAKRVMNKSKAGPIREGDNNKDKRQRKEIQKH
jgi:hypothetical protein